MAAFNNQLNLNVPQENSQLNENVSRSSRYSGCCLRFPAVGWGLCFSLNLGTDASSIDIEGVPEPNGPIWDYYWLVLCLRFKCICKRYKRRMLHPSALHPQNAESFLNCCVGSPGCQDGCLVAIETSHLRWTWAGSYWRSNVSFGKKADSTFLPPARCFHIVWMLQNQFWRPNSNRYRPQAPCLKGVPTFTCSLFQFIVLDCILTMNVKVIFRVCSCDVNIFASIYY